MHYYNLDPTRTMTAVASTPTPGVNVCQTGAISTGLAGNASPAQCGPVYASSTCDEYGCGYPGIAVWGCGGDSGGGIFHSSTADGIVHGKQWSGGGACGMNISETWMPFALAGMGVSMAPA